MNEMTVPNKPHSMRKFSIIFTGQAFSLLGSQLVQFSLAWWLTMTTGRASVLAFSMIMALLPQILISPVAGTLVDRWNRRVVMIAADGFIALTIVLLAGLYAVGAVQMWHIYAVMFIRSVGAAFHWPAMQASISLLVPKDQLSRIQGLNQALSGMMGIFAPLLGALLLEILSMQSILMIDVGTAALAIAPLIVISIPQPMQTESSQEGKSSMVADLHETFRYLRNWKGGQFIIVGAMLINLLYIPAVSLTPLLATYFGGGAREFAWLQSATGIGMVLGGLSLGVWGGFQRRIVTAMFALLLAGVGAIVAGLTPTFLLAVIGLLLAGTMLPITNGSLFAILQAIVPPEMQGRFFTMVASSSAAMTPIGLAMAGPIADVLGVQFWFLIGGLAMAIISVIAFFSPSIMQIEEINLNVM
ncbi:MAG: MFS transporter [Candidatus Heimdallarchaeota archaeon]